MMRPDIRHLGEFYASPQGRVARRLIERRLATLEPVAPGTHVLGLGYAGPFLGGFARSAARVISMMPHEQGCAPWPKRRENRAALVQETMLPLADRSIDVAVLVHAIEGTDRVHRLLREVWRVLADSGRLVAIVPNRRGLWCLAERTPFGYGVPYSASQLKGTLERNLFRAVARERALYVPPFRSKAWLRTAPLWERAGTTLARQVSGVIIAEAEKTTVGATAVLAAAATPAARVRSLPAQNVAARDAEPSARGGRTAGVVAFTTRRRRG